MAKEILFSVTKDDLEWDYFRCGGHGGQKQNKTSSGVRVRHAPSGALAESRVHAKQIQNKRAAFEKLAKSPIFEAWRRRKAADITRTKEQKRSDEERMMRWLNDSNIRVEIKNAKGEWVAQGKSE